MKYSNDYNNYKYRTAQLVSAIFNPLLLFSAFPFVLLVKFGYNYIYAFKWSFILAICMLGVFLYIFYQIKRGKYSDFDVSIREQRKSLFIAYTIAFILFFLTVLIFNGPVSLVKALLSIFLGLLIQALINTRIKISGHVAVITALSVTTIVVFGGKYWLSLLLIPLMIWSRVTLKRHTLKESLAGMTLAIILVLAVYTVAKVIFHF